METINLNQLDFCIEEYKKTNETLENDTKILKELSISYDVLTKHLSTIDLSDVNNNIIDKRKSLNDLTTKFNDLKETLKIYKKNIQENLKLMHARYIELENIIEFKMENESDKFIVEMSKLLYPNVSDCLDLRQEPPISGVLKRII